jgi:hypothetical protein
MTTIDVQDREDLIDSLEQTPVLASELVADQVDEQLRRAGPGGSLGAVEVLSYLRDFEDLFLGRLIMMVEGDNPRIEWVEDSLWPIERDYVNQDPLVMLQEFVEMRSQTVQILIDLPIPDWERTGRHPVMGQVSIRRYVERVGERDTEYLDQLRAALGQSAN